MLFKHANPQYCAVVRFGKKKYNFINGELEVHDKALCDILAKRADLKSVVEGVAVVESKEEAIEAPKKKKKKSK